MPPQATTTKNGTCASRSNRTATAGEFSIQPGSVSELTVGAGHQLMTLAEVAKELRCSKAHVCHLVNGTIENAPHLPCVQLGRRKLIRRHTLELWTHANEQAREIDSGQENDILHPSGITPRTQGRGFHA